MAKTQFQPPRNAKAKTHKCEAVKRAPQVILDEIDRIIESAELKNEFNNAISRIKSVTPNQRVPRHNQLAILTRFLFSCLLLKSTAHDPVMHLSTNMCPAHRHQIIAQIRAKLNPKAPEPVICVSTQLIEAGVDHSCGGRVRPGPRP